MKIQHLARFNIAGFSYYNGALVFRKLKIGKKLQLKLEKNNKYDARAVAIYYKEHKIGFVPRTDNRIFHKLLMVGLDNNIRLVVQQVDASANPENQVYVVAHLVNDSCANSNQKASI